MHGHSVDKKKGGTMLNIAFTVTYYLELHSAVTFCRGCHFLPIKGVNVL